MRAFMFTSIAMLLAFCAGCELNPGYGSLPREEAGRGHAANAPAQNGLSLQPLSGGSQDHSVIGQDASLSYAQPQYAPPERSRLPSPYDPILQGRYQYSAPIQPAVSPVYSYPVTSAPVTSAIQTQPIMTTTAVVGGGSSLRLIPAADIPPSSHSGDAGPSQWFEIVRPDNGPVRIGRLSTTCVCIGARAPKRHIAAGERALIEVRTLTRPPQNNITYGLYVGVLEPEKLTLDTDVTVRF